MIIELHPLNIFLISFTLEVLKLDKYNDIKYLDPLNIPCILLIIEVLKFVKSNDVKFTLLNIK